ncbi:hypothetical protein JHK85_054970 [Glycine max]|nr:hypothetical protein JHK86_054015 [Glycine max]KAG4928484.1 hypothetical protein JHK85_054970 [Glycine max]
MADKQPHLNGAYYGPAIPPAEQPRYRPHRGRSCCCCLFGILWKILVALIVLVGLAILIFWLVVQPRYFKFHVTKADLTQFDYYSNNNTLHYNMVLNFTARNPNKKLSIYYDKVEALAFYEDVRFANYDVITHMNSFRQYKKSSSPMSAVFTGQQVLMLNNEQVSELNQDKNAGVYDIYVKLYFRIRFRLGDVISNDYKPKVKCHLKVPFSKNGTFTLFPTTKLEFQEEQGLFFSDSETSALTTENVESAFLKLLEDIGMVVSKTALECGTGYGKENGVTSDNNATTLSEIMVDIISAGPELENRDEEMVKLLLSSL